MHRWHGLLSSQVMCAFRQCTQARDTFFAGTRRLRFVFVGLSPVSISFSFARRSCSCAALPTIPAVVHSFGQSLALLIPSSSSFSGPHLLIMPSPKTCSLPRQSWRTAPAKVAARVFFHVQFGRLKIFRHEEQGGGREKEEEEVQKDGVGSQTNR